MTAVLSTQTSAPTAPPHRNRDAHWRIWRTLIQVGSAVVIILAWQFLPQIDFLSERFKVLNKFYVSSPTDVYDSIITLLYGDAIGQTVWPALWTTVRASVIGTAIGLVLGAVAGLLFSNSKKLSEVVSPFVVLANSVPRIAIIPISVVIFGPTPTASVFNVITVVFFVGFFNAFEGGRSVNPAMLDNARLLGASGVQRMRAIRWPMVTTWTFAAVPNAISFGLIIAVTTELLAGIPGMGSLLQNATTNLQTSLTFAIIVILSVVGLFLYGGALLIKRAVLRWET